MPGGGPFNVAHRGAGRLHRTGTGHEASRATCTWSNSCQRTRPTPQVWASMVRKPCVTEIMVPARPAAPSKTKGKITQERHLPVGSPVLGQRLSTLRLVGQAGP